MNGLSPKQDGSMPEDVRNTYQGGAGSAGYRPNYGGQTGGSPSGGLTAMNLLRIILSRWMTVFLLGIFGGLIGVLYTQLAVPIYSAKAQLEMGVRRPRVTENEAVFDDSGGIRDADSIFNTRFAKFKSPAMEGLVADEYLKRYPDQDMTRSGRIITPYALAVWMRDVSWYKDPGANIVYVSYESSDPEFAAQLVNVVTYCAGVLMMRENQALSDEAVKWLKSQLEEQRTSLDEVENQLAAMREELQLDSLQQQKTALGQSLVSVSQEREERVSQLESRKAVDDLFSELKETDPDFEMLPTGLLKEEQLNELIRVWRAANDELLLAADRYTELHPERQRAEEKEARSREQLDQFITLSSMAVQNEIELLEKQVAQFDERIKIMKSEALELERLLGTGMQRVQSLQRKRSVADDAYQAMLRRMEEARLSADESMAYTKVIRNAAVPKIPVRPRKMQAIAMSIILGLLAGSAFAVVVALWRDKITSVNDLKALNLNVLGTIPPQKKIDSRAELGTIGLRDRFSHIVEIFAGINALISSDKYAGRTKMMLISSVMPGEGKTISTCNLAICSAFNGSRTLLIDGDLRRPQLARIFSIGEEHPSLLEWLSNNGSELRHDQLVSRGVIENLDVITSRHLEKINPAELLGRGQLVELLDWARENYDRVIIDSPPLGPVGDAQVFANQADSIIMVSRIGKTSRRGLKFSLARFHEMDAHVLGCIANDVPHSLAGLFGGAEGYGYGYGGEYKSYGRD